MRKKELPAIPATERRPGISFELPKSAVARWNPSIAPSAATDADATVIDVLDFIGPEEGGGVSSKTISRALAAAGGKAVTVNINSPGGDMIDGVTIYNMLREYPGSVTVKVPVVLVVSWAHVTVWPSRQ